MGAAIPQPTVGQGDLRYRFVEGWGKLPDGWLFGEVAAVAVDRKDRVYAFSRGEHPMIVFDREGNFLRSWGEGLFRNAHGLHMGADDTLWCTDDGDHTVRRMTLEGKLLLEIGVPGKPAPKMSGLPFHRCTHTALSPEGDIYVTDGYGNARVHKYSPDGKLLSSWGEPGTGPGQFNIVHNVVCDRAGWLYVADRENHRVQVFDRHGKYQTQWGHLHRPCGLCQQAGDDERFYIGELGPGEEFSNRDWPGLGPRLSVVDKQGRLLSRIGDVTPSSPSRFLAPHGLAVDSAGAIYVGEVSRTRLKRKGGLEEGKDPLCLQKLERVPVA